MTLDYARLAHAVARREEGGAVSFSPDPTPLDPAAADLVRAQGEVCALEAAFAAASPALGWKLLAIDPAYQAARAEVAFRTGDAPPAVGLTGPYAEIEALASLADLVARVRAHAKDPWAISLLHDVLGPAVTLVDAADAGAIAAYAAACRRRADAALPVVDARGLSFADFRSPHESSFGDRDRPCAWPCCVVSVRRLDGPGQGSGVFLTPSLVLTAAHVVDAGGRLAVDVPEGGEPRAVRTLWIDPAWRAGRAVDRDYALLQVEATPGLGLPVIWDFGAAGGSYPVARYGRPPQGEAYQMGHVERARRIFVSADLHVPNGASGGGLFYESAGVVYAVGVTTNEDPVAPGQKSFVGLPLIQGVMADMDHPVP